MRACDNCGNELTAVFPEQNRRHTDVQYTDALALTLGGGYAMFTDDLPAGPLSRPALLCHGCSHALLAALPGLAKFVYHNGSHPSPEV